MKILLVAHFFPPKRNAGAEKRTLGYAIMLQKLGHTVQVVCAGDWDVGEYHWNGFTDEVYQGVSVRRVNLNWTRADDPNRSLYDNPLVEENLSIWLADWQPDIVHIVSLITLGAGVVRSAKKLGIPVIFTLVDFWTICPKISLMHGDGSICDGNTSSWDCLKCLLWESKVYNRPAKVLPENFVEALLTWASRRVWLNRQRGLRGMALDINDRKQVMAEIAPLVDCVIAPSTNLGRVIERRGIFSPPVRIIHSGHDLTWLDKMPERQPEDVIRFGFIGQLIPVKGVDVLIHAFQTTANKGEASLLIYGSAKNNPKYAASLQAVVRPEDNIHFLGEFKYENLGEVLSGFDVLVVPSQWHENNPRVIQEAFAGRMPVIASNVGGITEFVEHNVNGLLFEHDSIDDLRVQIDRILTEPELIQRLKSEIKPVKTIAEEIREIIEIYKKLVPIADEDH